MILKVRFSNLLSSFYNKSLKLIATNIIVMLFAAETQSQNCFDFTNLYSDSTVTCTYGSYHNPTQDTGVVNIYRDDSYNRHVVKTDTTETDPRTGDLLYVIAPGQTASVRLGNWRRGKEAESITYNLSVDNDEPPILLLKYAAVLQHPDHTDDDQPKLRIEVLDDAGNLIGGSCGEADFVANDSLGWNEYGTGFYRTLWKDWTTVGFDLEPYRGRNIQIRASTYDCDLGAHYGYAYIAFECTDRRVENRSCGDNGALAELKAPEGFHYRWYNNNDSAKTTLSTDRIYTVAISDYAKYICEMSFVGEDTCRFELESIVQPLYPHARFDHSIDNSECFSEVSFENQSFFAKDTSDTAEALGDTCDYVFWDFGNGQTSAEYHPSTPVVYTEAGYYTVTLHAFLTGGCKDSISKQIYIPNEAPKPTSDLIAICPGDTLIWTNGKRYFTNVFGTEKDTFVVARGCDSVVSLELRVLEPMADFDYTLDNSKCLSEVSFNNTSSLSIHDTLPADSGLTHFWDFGNGQTSNERHPSQAIVYDSIGYYGVTLTVEFSNGCKADITQQIFIPNEAPKPTSDSISICLGDTLIWTNGKRYFTNVFGTEKDTFVVERGCDSVVSLELRILEPLADFDYTLDNSKCLSEVSFRNMSRLSIHDTLPADSGLLHFWDFGNGQTSNERHPSQAIVYDSIGHYDVTLTVTFANGCKADITQQIYIPNEAPKPTSDSISICLGDTLIWTNGKRYFTNVFGTEKDTFTVARDCDSVVSLELRILEPLADFDYTLDNSKCLSEVSFNNTSSLSANGVLLADSGLTHFWDFGNGQTSNERQPSQAIVYEFIGNYDVTLTVEFANGCKDSITQQIFIPIEAPKPTSDTISICFGDTLIWTNGKRYFTNVFGTEKDTFTVARGCDSVVSLVLTILPEIQFDLRSEPEDELSENGIIWIENIVHAPNYTYSLNGVMNAPLTGLSAGEYEMILFNELGCASSPQSVTVSRVCRFAVNDSIFSICGNERGFDISFAPTSGQPTHYSITFDSLALSAGFSNIDSRAVSTRDDAVSVEIQNNARPNHYSMELSLWIPLCEAQDFPIKFTILYPASILIQKQMDAIALLNAQYNGGYTFSGYQWMKNNVPIPGETRANLYREGELLDPQASYKVLLTRADDGVTMASCELSPKIFLRTLMYPNVVIPGGIVYLKTEASGSATLIDLSGRVMQTYPLEADINRIEAPSLPGMYLVKIKAEQTDEVILKLLVR